MIINQIEGGNAKGGKTVDQDSGVYLQPIGADIRDHLYDFAVVDREATIRLGTVRATSLDERQKLKYVKYNVQSVSAVGPPQRTGYLEVIKSLLIAHGAGFRADERKFGVNEVVEVEVDKDAARRLSSWEAGDV